MGTGRSTLRVGVVGAGTAGQGASVLLARDGHAVTLFERAPRPGPVGAGILLQPTGLNVLGRIGVLDRVMALGSPVRRLRGTTVAGRSVLDLAYADLSPSAMGLGVHRGMLFQTLQRAVELAGVEMVAGVTIRGLREAGARRVLVDDGGGEHGPFDLVVVADGARSGLRGLLPVRQRCRPYAWGALWVIVPDAEGRFGETLTQVYGGTRRMVGFLPSGRVDESSPRTVSVFWSVPVARHEALRAAGLEAWKREVRALTEAAEPVLERVGDFGQLILATYNDTRMARPFDGPVVCIGDAAHAMSPQLGQGANLALMDAAALADAVAAEGDVGRALPVYARERAASVAFYRRASRWLTPVFQSGHSWIAPARDAVMGPMARAPWVRRQMLLSLAGVKTGVVSAGRVPDATGAAGGTPRVGAGALAVMAGEFR